MTTYATTKSHNQAVTYQSNGYGTIRTGRRIEYDDAPVRTNWLVVSAGLLICLSLCAGMAYMFMLAM